LAEKEDDPGLPKLPDAGGVNGAYLYITFEPNEDELAAMKK
jgi:hypothetical protein